MTPRESWGRFTYCGGASVETRLQDIVTDVVRTLHSKLDPERVRAVVLIGGYGRGEGGVERRDNGQEYPHNNLDFLLIGRGNMVDAADLKREIDPLLEEISTKVGIGLDLGITTEAKLSSSPCLIMWYDMRFGHKTLWGDSTFVPSLVQFEANRIPSWDARNLLVNRGTLLVINDALRERGLSSDVDRRLVVKHAIKAIIGYGDSLLYFLGAYHWSYAEKQRRMAARTDVPSDFKAIYDLAARFRFEPDYASWSTMDLDAWSEELRRALTPIHLRCEQLRLGHEFDWRCYLTVACAGELSGGNAPSLRTFAKRVITALRAEFPAETVSLLPSFSARWGARAAGPKGILPLLFPVIAYDLADPATRTVTQAFLEADDCSLSSLRRAYLRSWGTYGDINFGTVLRKIGLSVEKTPVISTDAITKEVVA
jgi:hypothetical protein